MNRQRSVNYSVGALLLALLLSPARPALADARTGPFSNQERPGMEYRAVYALYPQECQSACAMEAQCRSWTFAIPPRSKYGPLHGVCSLKSGVPHPRFLEGYVSGVKPPPPAIKADRNRARHKDTTDSDPPPPVVKR